MLDRTLGQELHVESDRTCALLSRIPMQDKLKPEEETGSLPNLAGRCTRT